MEKVHLKRENGTSWCEPRREYPNMTHALTKTTCERCRKAKDTAHKLFEDYKKHGWKK